MPLEPGVRTRELVFVAEDDDDIRTLVACRLSVDGFDVAVARDGEEALRLASERPPALAILDVRMPRLDGLEVARRLRADPTTSHVPVILLTASVQEADIARGLEADVDDYMWKPFSPHELGTRVRAILDGT